MMRMRAIADKLDKIISKHRIDKYNVSNIRVIHKTLGQRGWHFNCWGATSMYFGIISKPEWISESTMNKTIIDRFRRLKSKKDAQINDMLAFYCRGQLIHTAVMVGKDRFYHKIGTNLCTVDTLDQIKSIYNETDKIRYYRFNEE